MSDHLVPGDHAYHDDKQLVADLASLNDENPGGIVELPPASVRELATFIGCTYEELANYLAPFLPEEVSADAG